MATATKAKLKPPTTPRSAGEQHPPGNAGIRGVIPLSDIYPSKLNPRKSFPDDTIRELADSIVEHGILSPLLVRPIPTKGQSPEFAGGEWEGVDHWELVDGERRFRAAKFLKIQTVPITAHVLTDDQALTLMLIANDQREDVRPSEQAAGYAALAATGKTAEQIAEAVGKPVKFVRGLLRLGGLPAWVLAAVDSGKLHRATAELVARIPNESDREECAAHVIAGQSWRPRPGTGERKLTRKDSEESDRQPLTYRAAAEFIARHFQIELKNASFSRKALDLIEGAGSCDECPRRAGNDAEATAAGTRADVCLDPSCFQRKTDAHAAAAVKLAERQGKTVLPAKVSDRLFASGCGTLNYDAAYVDLDTKCYEAKGRTWRSLLKGHIDDTEVSVAVDPHGATHDLVDKKKAVRLIKSHHGVDIFGESAKSKGNDAYTKERRRQEAAAKLAKVAALKANGIVAEKMLANAGAVHLLRLVTATLADAAGADACRQIVKRRGLAPVKSKDKYGELSNATRGPVMKLAGEMNSVRELLGLLAELAAARRSASWGYGWMPSKDANAFWEAFGVDQKALVKQAAAEKSQAKGTKANAKPAPAAARKTEAQPAKPKPVPAPAPPGPRVTKAVGEGLLADIDGFPPAVLRSLAAAPYGIRTLADLAAIVEKQSKALDHAGRVYGAIRSVVGVDNPDDARDAMHAVLDHLHPGRKEAREAKAKEAPAASLAAEMADATEPAPTPPPPPDSSWRELTIDHLELPDIERKLRLAKVKTLGQCATMLHCGQTFALGPADLGKLCALIDDAAELDSTHKPLFRSEEL